MTLLSELKELDGACREMDARIHLLLHPLEDRDGFRDSSAEVQPDGSILYHWRNEKGAIGMSTDRDIMRFTGSVDAALTFIPEGWLIYDLSEKDCVNLTRYAITFRNNALELSYGDHNELAIAICIAALSARGIE